jgi:hypothetical protein
VYPGGRFDKNTQTLSPIGLGVLAGIAASGVSANCRIDGLNPRHNDIDPTIFGMVGMCLKPIDHSVLIIDFDFPVRDLKYIEDSDELKSFIESSYGAFATRGNRKRLTLYFRQSPDLFTVIAERVGKVRKMVLTNSDNLDWKIEISLTNGSQGNIAGLHKSGKLYLNHYPENGIAVMNVDMFDRFIESCNNASFNTASATNDCFAAGKIGLDEIIYSSRTEISTIARVANLLSKHDGFTLSVLDLLPQNTVGLIKGTLGYNNADKWFTSTTGTHVEGCRRDTLWQIVSDLSAVRTFLETVELPYDDSIFDTLISHISHMFVEDSAIVEVTVNGRYVRTYKWSPEYVLSNWEHARENERHAQMSSTYASAFIGGIHRQIANKAREVRSELQSR